MKLLSRNTLAFARVLLLASTLASLAAVAAPPPDIRVAIDVSGSMKTTDPRNLRTPALKLLADLLPNGASAGAWLFAENVTPLLPVSKVDARWKQGARAGAGKIHSRGQFTDIEQALRTAAQGWTGDAPDGIRHLVLLTDGKIDIGPQPGPSEASRARVLGELVDALAQRHIRVHTIALSADADKALLEGLSSRTGGWHEIAASADVLQRAFLHIFEQAASPDALPLKDNRFTVDASVKEVTLLIFRNATDAPVTLTDPAGQALTAAKAKEPVRWQSEAGYDLITIANPKPGAWQFSGPKDPDNRALVVTDLSLAVDPVPVALLAGQAVPVSVQLQERNQPISREDFLKLVQADAAFAGENGAGDLLNLPYDTAGKRFAAEGGQTLKAGPYELTLRAHSATFEREKRLRIQILGAPLQAAAEGVPASKGHKPGIVLQLKVQGDLAVPESLGGYVKIDGPNHYRDVVELAALSGDTGTLRFDVPGGGTYTLAISALLKTRQGQLTRLPLEPLTVTLAGGAPTAAPPALEVERPTIHGPRVDAMQTVLLVLGGNVLLVAVLGPLWWFLRRRALPVKGVSL